MTWRDRFLCPITLCSATRSAQKIGKAVIGKLTKVMTAMKSCVQIWQDRQSRFDLYRWLCHRLNKENFFPNSIRMRCALNIFIQAKLCKQSAVNYYCHHSWRQLYNSEKKCQHFGPSLLFQFHHQEHRSWEPEGKISGGRTLGHHVLKLNARVLSSASPFIFATPNCPCGKNLRGLTTPA